MPNATTKTGLRYIDPGGDPGHPQGGIVEVLGQVQSTQQSGWRQALITRALAT